MVEQVANKIAIEKYVTEVEYLGIGVAPQYSK